MAYKKTIVCLANSDKLNARCVAGRVRLKSGFGEWIRPVSEREKGEVSLGERRYEDRSDPKLLDVITIKLIAPKPHDHQKENHVLDASAHWEKVGAVSWNDLQAAIDGPAGPLWVNGISSGRGNNDQVPTSKLPKLSGSLYLVRPLNFRLLKVPVEGTYGSYLQLRASFDLGSFSYDLAVTDPVIKSQYKSKPEGETAIPEAVLCVSLGEPFKDYAYKLVASVITPKRAKS